MNGGGAIRFMARLIEEGLEIGWMKRLQLHNQPSSASGLSRGAIRQLHTRQAIKRAGRDNRGINQWAAGPLLDDYIHLAEMLEARQ